MLRPSTLACSVLVSVMLIREVTTNHTPRAKRHEVAEEQRDCLPELTQNQRTQLDHKRFSRERQKWLLLRCCQHAAFASTWVSEDKSSGDLF